MAEIFGKITIFSAISFIKIGIAEIKWSLAEREDNTKASNLHDTLSCKLLAFVKSPVGIPATETDSAQWSVSSPTTSQFPRTPDFESNLDCC
jgi:hypothetical protein